MPLAELIEEVARRQRGQLRLRMPVGVIGPRNAAPAQVDAARAVGRGIARMGLALVCGGRAGVMEGACQGAAEAGGIAIGVLPDIDAAAANAHATVVLATGIGEARNAVIARAALCLVAIGDNFGTLSEVALGRQFGKLVIGLEGAAQVEGVVQVATPEEALEQVARCALGAPAGS
ncbi:MAG: lysine decarboxylase [Rubrivivax sp.]